MCSRRRCSPAGCPCSAGRCARVSSSAPRSDRWPSARWACGAYAVAVALALGSLVTVVVSPDLTRESERARSQEAQSAVLHVMRRHARLLLTQGLGATVISALRTSRLVILPLWAVHIGLDGVDSSQIFVLAGIAELVLVYPGGWVMDRLGRVWVVTALLSVVSCAFLLLPLAGTKWGLLAVALIMAVGNGLGSGIVMTLGADVAAAVALGVLGLVGLAWTSVWVARADGERATHPPGPPERTTGKA